MRFNQLLMGEKKMEQNDGTKKKSNNNHGYWSASTQTGVGMYMNNKIL